MINWVAERFLYQVLHLRSLSGRRIVSWAHSFGWCPPCVSTRRRVKIVGPEALRPWQLADDWGLQWIPLDESNICNPLIQNICNHLMSVNVSESNGCFCLMISCPRPGRPFSRLPWLQICKQSITQQRSWNFLPGNSDFKDDLNIFKREIQHDTIL